MGWFIEFKSDRDIKEEEAQQIVDNLPSEYRYKGMFKPIMGIWETSRQNWGWSAAVDINLPEGNTITIGGSYGMSGDIADKFARYFKKELQKLGHKIRRRSYW